MVLCPAQVAHFNQQCTSWHSTCFPEELVGLFNLEYRLSNKRRKEILQCVSFSSPLYDLRYSCLQSLVLSLALLSLG